MLETMMPRPAALFFDYFSPYFIIAASMRASDAIFRRHDAPGEW